MTSPNIIPSSVREDFERRLGSVYPKEEIPIIIQAAARVRDNVAFVDKMVTDRERVVKNVVRTDGRFKGAFRKGALNNPDRRTEGLKRVASRRVESVANFNQRRLLGRRLREPADAESEFWRKYDLTHGRF